MHEGGGVVSKVRTRVAFFAWLNDLDTKSYGYSQQSGCYILSLKKSCSGMFSFVLLVVC